MVKKALKATGGTEAPTNLQPQIRKVFEIIQALPPMNIFESVEELDRYLAAIQRKAQDGGNSACCRPDGSRGPVVRVGTGFRRPPE